MKVEKIYLIILIQFSFNFSKNLYVLGFLVLASKVRKPEEEQTIIQILEKHFKCSLSLDRLFTCKIFIF